MLYENMTIHILTDHPDKNTLTALRYIAKFGWLRAYELGRFMYFDSKNFRERASNLLSRLHKRKLVIERQLPHTAGKAFVLSKRGGDYLKNTFDMNVNEHSLFKSGKNIGRTVDGSWLPNNNFEHDLLACSTLAQLQADGATIYSERQIRLHPRGLLKIPDGFAIKDGKGIWVEVENSRKSGNYMRIFASSLATILNTGIDILGVKTHNVLIAYPEFKRDEKDHFINHQLRTSNAISSFLKANATVTYMPLQLIGLYSSSALKPFETQLKAEHWRRIAKQIEWRSAKNNSQVAHYYDFKLDIIALKDAYIYEIHDTQKNILTKAKGKYPHISAAKEALAQNLEELIATHR